MKKYTKPILAALCVLAVLAVAYFAGGGNSDKAPAPAPDTSAAEPSVDTPPPMDAEDAVISDVEHTCTLSVRCDTLLDRLDTLAPEKAALVPVDGALYAEQEVTFYEGESVFNLLAREMKQNGIHLEFVNTPLYGSAYIEGIGNLYEFDCGELSGWMYKVNGIFPEYGCSNYKIKNGDVIEWMYTCDLGTDIGKGDKLQSDE